MDRYKLSSKLNLLVSAVNSGDRKLVDKIIDKDWANRRAAKRHLAKVGLELPRKQRVLRKVQSSKLLLVLADLINTEDTNVTIADRHGCSRQYVEQAVRQAEGVGIKLNSEHTDARR